MYSTSCAKRLSRSSIVVVGAARAGLSEVLVPESEAECDDEDKELTAADIAMSGPSVMRWACVAHQRHLDVVYLEQRWRGGHLRDVNINVNYNSLAVSACKFGLKTTRWSVSLSATSASDVLISLKLLNSEGENFQEYSDCIRGNGWEWRGDMTGGGDGGGGIGYTKPSTTYETWTKYYRVYLNTDKAQSPSNRPPKDGATLCETRWDRTKVFERR
ncbi:hypothetical protein BKA62DRAFT_673950 [Auriculariales sp. MPI-PUGE-AT-0066]|nr:hypothetical protein BKA62DRAFT_673950 [Auriculariales sp. MPI-PUGE-AT-0066]